MTAIIYNIPSRIPRRFFCAASVLLAATFLFPSDLCALSISEKKSQLASKGSFQKNGNGSLEGISEGLKEKKKELLSLYIQANNLYSGDTNENTTLIKQKTEAVRKTKQEIALLEQEWKEVSQDMLIKEEDALWQQPDTTVGQLVVDYGGADCIYLMPPEISTLRVHVSSDLSIPRASWQEILNLILASYGVGIKELHPFVKQLYFLRLNQSGLTLITDKREELELLPRESKIAFVFTPQPHELRRTFHFLEKFVPAEQVSLQIIGGNLIATGPVGEIIELMKIYDFTAQPKQSQDWRLIVLQKGQSEEMARILQTLFSNDGGSSSSLPLGPAGDGKIPFSPSQEGATFLVMPLKFPLNSLFLIGKKDQLEKAEEIIRDIEGKIGEMQEKSIHWYACKHSDADELAKVLSQVYVKLIQITSPDSKNEHGSSFRRPKDEVITFKDEQPYSLDNAPLVVNPSPLIITDRTKKQSGSVHDNFIVDQKTNSIVMVIESYILPKLKELLKKLDVPKKMVQIDVLLFEKRINDHDSFGMNLLKMGDAVKESHATKLTWNDTSKNRIENKGILLFTIIRKSDWFPKYDLAYKFLLSQTGIHINANPTVTTVNQTPAKIVLVDEISINTGVIEVDTNTSTRLKDSYSRAQYGTIIQVTPTIHAKSENDDDDVNETKFITLETDVNFDTTKPSVDSRPEVSRRNIKNEIRIADGETVIIGGLRRKQSHSNRDIIPFLGELPGVGKLFSTSALTDDTTEMYIFITPKIIPDKKEEYHAMRLAELKKRPGDIPEYLQQIEEARKDEKRERFYHTMKVLTGELDPW